MKINLSTYLLIKMLSKCDFIKFILYRAKIVIIYVRLKKIVQSNKLKELTQKTKMENLKN